MLLAEGFRGGRWSRVVVFVNNLVVSKSRPISPRHFLRFVLHQCSRCGLIYGVLIMVGLVCLAFPSVPSLLNLISLNS